VLALAGGVAALVAARRVFEHLRAMANSPVVLTLTSLQAQAERLAGAARTLRR